MSDEQARREKFMKERAAHLEKLGEKDIGQNIFIDCGAINTEDVWIVGRETARLDGHPDYFTWDFLGVYDDYDLALKKCVTEQHFLFPAPLNHAEGEILPTEIKKGSIKISEILDDD